MNKSCNETIIFVRAYETSNKLIKNPDNIYYGSGTPLAVVGVYDVPVPYLYK